MKKPAIVSIAILVFTLAAVLVFEMEPAVSSAKRQFARRIPLQLGDWKGSEEPLDEEVIEVLGTDDMLMRNYVNDRGDVITFAAVFAKDNRRAVHEPMVCYNAQGWSVQEKGVAEYDVQPPASGYVSLTGYDDATGDNTADPKAPPELDSIEDFAEPIKLRPMELVIRQEHRWRVVHYYYKTGSRTTFSQHWQVVNMSLNKILTREASNSLLRISTTAASGSPEDLDAARKLVREFSQLVYPYIIAGLP